MHTIINKIVVQKSKNSKLTRIVNKSLTSNLQFLFKINYIKKEKNKIFLQLTINNKM